MSGFYPDGASFKCAFANDRFREPNTSPLPEFTDVAETLMVGETPASSSIGINYGYAMSTTGFASTPYVAPVHFEGTNWLYVDGHVKWLKPEVATASKGTTTYYLWRRVKP